MSDVPATAPLLAEQMELVAMQNNSMYNALARPSMTAQGIPAGTSGAASRFSPGSLYTALSLPARMPKVKFSEAPPPRGGVNGDEEELLQMSPRRSGDSSGRE